MTHRLIVNADDYGRTPEVSRGIREAHLRGIVTSTTALMNMPSIEHDLRLALQETPELGLGVHLVLTSGFPLLPAERIPTLVSEDGAFPGLEVFMARVSHLDPAQAKAEWRAQIERFVLITGRAPSHLDSHHHASYYTEALFDGMLELAREYGCPIRSPFAENADSLDWIAEQLRAALREFPARLLAKHGTLHPDAFHVSFYDEGATPEELVRILESLPEGVSELMCHPGYAAGLDSVYAHQRERELSILTDPQIRETVHRRGIELITFAELS